MALILLVENELSLIYKWNGYLLIRYYISNWQIRALLIPLSFIIASNGLAI